MTHNTLSVNLFLVWYLIFLNGITALHEKGSTKIQNYAIHKFNKRKFKKKNSMFLISSNLDRMIKN